MNRMDESSQAVRILIASNQAIYRECLKHLVSSQKDFVTVGEAAGIEETRTLLKRVDVDILLLDLATLQPAGIEILRSLDTSGSRVRTIVLGTVDEGGQIAEIFHQGARGFLPKEAPTRLFFKSIRCVMAGQYWIILEGAPSLVRALSRLKSSSRMRKRPKNFGLTSREMEIVSAVITGSTNRKMALQFSVSEQTVKNHLTNIFNKLGVYNRLELALYALHHGLIRKH